MKCIHIVLCMPNAIWNGTNAATKTNFYDILIFFSLLFSRIILINVCTVHCAHYSPFATNRDCVEPTVEILVHVAIWRYGDHIKYHNNNIIINDRFAWRCAIRKRKQRATCESLCLHFVFGHYTNDFAPSSHFHLTSIPYTQDSFIKFCVPLQLQH